MKKQNIDWVQVSSILGSMLTIGATLLTNFANEKKLDQTIEDKVAEALKKQLNQE